MPDTVLVEKKGRVAVFTLSNPDERNALTGRMRRELTAALAAADGDPAIGAMLLRGEGGLSFCAGGSMTDLAGLYTRADAEAMCAEGTAMLNALSGTQKPVIAAVSGWCVGDGFELALCCDLIYASATARFCMPEVDLGLTMGWGGAVRLAKRVNLIRAREILLTGRRIPADEAAAMGLINRALPAEDFFPAVEKIAQSIAQKPAQALRAIKTITSTDVLDGSYPASQQLGGALVADLMMTDDFRAAIAAFREKHKAK